VPPGIRSCEIVPRYAAGIVVGPDTCDTVRVSAVEFLVLGVLSFGVLGVLGFGFWVMGFESWVLGLGFGVLGCGFWVLDPGFWGRGLVFQVRVWGVGVRGYLGPLEEHLGLGLGTLRKHCHGPHLVCSFGGQCLVLIFEGLRCRVPSSGFRVEGLGFGGWGLGVWVWSLGFGVWGLGAPRPSGRA